MALKKQQWLGVMYLASVRLQCSFPRDRLPAPLLLSAPAGWLLLSSVCVSTDEAFQNAVGAFTTWMK